MIFITSDIQVLATLTNDRGEMCTVSWRFRTARRGLFKEEMERMIMQELAESDFPERIVGVRVH